MTIGEGCKAHRPVSVPSRASGWALSSPRQSGTPSALIHLSTSRSISPSLMNETRDIRTPSLGAVTHPRPKGSNPLFPSRVPRPQTSRCWPSSPPLQTWLQSVPVFAEDHGAQDLHFQFSVQMHKNQMACSNSTHSCSTPYKILPGSHKPSSSPQVPWLLQHGCSSSIWGWTTGMRFPRHPEERLSNSVRNMYHHPVHRQYLL